MPCPHCQAEIADDARFCGACGRTLTGGAPRPTVDSIVGQVVAGRYRVIAKLGAGGMGTVFRAEQLSLKRPVALKVLDPALFNDEAMVRRFNAEAELAARLSHPHTVTLYDFGEAEGGLLYIAMELLPGRSLRDLLRKEGPLPAGRVLGIAEQIASSLADAHGQGIVHRDLKPDNVMLSERAGRSDFVRVLDFGIAKLRDDRSQGPSVMGMTQAGQLLGTPQYMAPEQVLGQKVDGRTDVYALGVMLYELLVGRPPFESGNVMALLSMHMHEPVPPPETRNPGVGPPPAAGERVTRGRAQPPQAPAPMGVVLEQLAALRASLGVDSPPPGSLPGVSLPAPTPPPTPPPMAIPAAAPRAPRRNALPWVLLGLLVAGGATAGIVVATRGGDEEETSADDEDDGDEDREPEPEPARPRRGDTRFQVEGVGVYLDLPPGFRMQSTGVGQAAGEGMIDGQYVAIVTNFAVPGVGEESVILEILQRVGGTLVRAGLRDIRGTPCTALVIENAQGRMEVVFYPRPQFTAVIAVATTAALFDGTAAVRDDIFGRRVGFND